MDEDGRTLLVRSANGGRQEEAINAILQPGKYVVQVSPKGGARTDYRLEVNAEPFGEITDRLPGVPLGDLLERTETEPVFGIGEIGFTRGSTRDQNDYFTFSLNEDAFFYADLDQLSANVDLQIHEYDLNNPNELGELLSESDNRGRNPEIISGEVLEAGEYAVRVRPKGNARTDYRLELNAFDQDLDDYPTPETAKDLGEITETDTKESGNIGRSILTNFRDQADWYKFTLSSEKISIWSLITLELMLMWKFMTVMVKVYCLIPETGVPIQKILTRL